MHLLILACVVTVLFSQHSFATSDWPVTTYGNHRYSIPIPQAARLSVAFVATINWRRTGSDLNISKSRILTQTNEMSDLANVVVLNSSRFSATIAIDARNITTENVYIYYYPFIRSGSVYGMQVTYLNSSTAPIPTAATLQWRKALANGIANLPHVEPNDCIYQARTPFDSFTDLERTSNLTEVNTMLQLNKDPVLVFPEPRSKQIRMLWHSPYASAPTLPDLPVSWTSQGPSLTLDAGHFKNGEYITFQIGLYASTTSLTSVTIGTVTPFYRISSNSMKQTNSFLPSIAANLLTCFNLDGVDVYGDTFTLKYSVPHMQVGALIFGLDAPKSNVLPGKYSGNVTLLLDTIEKTINIQFTIEDTARVSQSGDTNLTALTRTRWINSKAGITTEPPKRFSFGIVIDKEKNTLTTWNTIITLSKTGLPSSLIRKGKEQKDDLLAKNISMLNETMLSSCSSIVWGSNSNKENVTWSVDCSLQIVVGSLDADGTMLFEIQLQKTETDSPISLNLPFKEKAVPFMMGFGKQGGYRRKWNWRWWKGTIEDSNGASVNTYSDNLLWIGSTEHGVRIKLLGPEEKWLGALNRVSTPPVSWGGYPMTNITTPTNVGGFSLGLMCRAPNCTIYSGGANVSLPDNNGIVNVKVFRGSPLNASSTTTSFRFELLLTPSVELNTSAHFTNQGRYYQYEPDNAPVKNASFFLNAGVRVVNIHQGLPVLNPFINYPFEEVATKPLTTMSSELHDAGAKMKLYYTTRELSDHTAEIWMLKALRQEILDGPGATPSFRNTAGKSGGASWLQEHLDSHYSVCWSTPSYNLAKDGMLDAAVCDNGDAHQRWSNYYVTGLEYLVQNPPYIDGLYLDGVAFDRNTMKRCRKVMDNVKEGCLIDLHSGDNFNPLYGSVSPAVQYMHLMPYFDSVMFGEGYQTGYDQPANVLDGGGPDWWLIEVSGIPFGLMNDMLGQSKSQLWRGFVFGCVTRLPYSHIVDNQQVWKIWDDWKLNETTMSGWWSNTPMVRAVAVEEDDEEVSLCGTAVVATAYSIPGVHTVVALASWANTSVVCDFDVDWKQIGLNETTTITAFAPQVPLVPIPSTGFFFQNASTWKIDGGKVRGVVTKPMRGWVFVLNHKQK